MPQGGDLTLRTALAPEGTRPVRLEVIDTGIGMDDETRRRCLEPFFTTKGERGSGLGLAMVYGTMRAHHGEVVLRSAPGQGTTALLRLPAAEAARSTAAGPPAGVVPAPAAGPILVIDDEPLVRAATRRLLGAEHIESVEASGGAEGIAIFAARPRDFSLVVLDLAMPEMSGGQCFAHLRAIDPEVPILLASGYPKDQSVEQLLSAGRADFISKPYRRQEFLAAVARCRRHRGG